MRIDRRQTKDTAYLRMCRDAAYVSTCPRRSFGAILIDTRGRLKGHGYNGTVAHQPNLCGGDYCLRDGLKCKHCRGKGTVKKGSKKCYKCNGKGRIDSVKSGTRPDIGCIHAEMNLLINSNRDDLALGTLYVNGEPCIFCAKMIAQADLARVVCYDGGYPTKEGVEFLLSNGVLVDLYTQDGQLVELRCSMCQEKVSPLIICEHCGRQICGNCATATTWDKMCCDSRWVENAPLDEYELWQEMIGRR